MQSKVDYIGSHSLEHLLIHFRPVSNAAVGHAQVNEVPRILAQ